jgi:hypothetical protein
MPYSSFPAQIIRHGVLKIVCGAHLASDSAGTGSTQSQYNSECYFLLWINVWGNCSKCGDSGFSVLSNYKAGKHQLRILTRCFGPDVPAISMDFSGASRSVLLRSGTSIKDRWRREEVVFCCIQVY